MTNYRRGYDAERKAKEKLEGEGYYVMRSAGSHGQFDLIAIGSMEVLAIQVKRSKVNKIHYPEMDELKFWIFPPIVHKQFWVWLDRQRCWKIYTVL